MSNPNEPRLMKPRRDEARVYSNRTGDAGQDGYTRLAGRKHPGDHAGEDVNSPFGPSMGTSDSIQPQVGERDWNRGHRYSEDY